MTLAPNPWQIALDRLYPKLNPYVSDPVGWVEDVLGEHVWSKQAKMMRSVVEYDRNVVKAGHSVGKTRGLSRLVAWFISVHPIGQALVVVTSDNDDQIKGGIWRELIALHETHDLPGKLTLDAKWHAGPTNQQLVAFGRKPSDRNPTGLAGFHARHLLVIIDECCGLPQELWDAADSLASNEGGIVLACGNPTDPSAYMAEVCKPGSGWRVQQIRSTDTPEFTGEKVPPELEGVLASKAWVEKRKRVWGETSPTYISRILGEFPDVSNDTLIHPKWIEAAQKRSLPRNHRPKLSCDIARYGEDETVIMRREGGWVRLYHAHHQADTMTTAGHIAKAIKDINQEPDIEDYVTTSLDEVGVGGGVLDRLLEQGYDVAGLNAGAAPIDRERFQNAKAEWYWTVRQTFEAGEIDIDPDDDRLAAQLGSIKWTVDSRGRIKIESKDDMRKRGLPSPDRADALVQTWVEHGALALDVESHQGPSLTGDLLTKAW